MGFLVKGATVSSGGNGSSSSHGGFGHNSGAGDKELKAYRVEAELSFLGSLLTGFVDKTWPGSGMNAGYDQSPSDVGHALHKMGYPSSFSKDGNSVTFTDPSGTNYTLRNSNSGKGTLEIKASDIEEYLVRARLDNKSG